MEENTNTCPQDNWRERVEEEKKELDIKMTRLAQFVFSPGSSFESLDEVMRGLLISQLSAMQVYSTTLGLILIITNETI